MTKHIIEINNTHMEILLQTIKEHRAAALPAQTPTVPSTTQVCAGRKKLSSNMHHEVGILKRLRFVRNQQSNPYVKQTLPVYIGPVTLYPAKAELHKVTKFDKSNKNKSFIVAPVRQRVADGPDKPAIQPILLQLLKSGFLDQTMVSTFQAMNVHFDLLI